MALATLKRWFRRTPGAEVLSRWQVDEALWRSFLAAEQRRGGQPDNELPMPDAVPAGGLEVVVEPDGLWLGGKHVSLPLRGTPEILSALLQDPGGGAPTTIELSLKYPPRATSSGSLLPPTFSRLSVPVPGHLWHDARKVVAHFNRDTPGTPDFFHGRGDGSDPEDLSTCLHCGHQTHKFRSQCEHCGGSLLSRRWSRRFGGVLVVCGLILTGLMGGVLYFTLPILMDAMSSGGTSRFSGSAGQAAVVLAVLGSVLVFGVTALAYGIWQMATGQRSLKVIGFLVTLFSALMTLGVLVPWLLD